MIKSVFSIDLPVLENMHIWKNRIEPLNKSGAEKRICIVSGIHGDELEGQYICYEIIRRIKANIHLLHGIVDIYPCLNPLGIESLTRGIPAFDLDLNRCFPGNRNGDMAENAAQAIVEDILGSELCVDLHSSNIFLREIPQVRMIEENAKMLLPYAKLLNLDFVWVHPSATVQNATLTHALNTSGVPTIAVEMGTGMRITKQFGDQITEGIFCLLKELGMWEGEVITPKTPIISTEGGSEVTMVHAEASGIFLPEVEHWMGIKKGEVIGDIVDSLTGEINQHILAPCDGMVFTLREYPVVNEGSLIVRILGGNFT
ncbi:M14 family metallopeptidase [Anaerocolumna sp. AGMB13020]|uniref:M14 family metallopeptidase n=1 Tax=Anaerocolumna sp. AGMB13020 TaxID=3081750 RepID=UPI0029536E6D|nr:M14 family metallopeptidase [Anaerocolumna sp. AGMB13020]WOO35582.1 M14 family metallopeptidase [Anaerocolumna sp. AGMB13020]